MFDRKSICITGGSGSFGRRHIQTLLRDYRPKRIVVYSRDNSSQQNL